ncbi:hypothetical protein MSG28_008227, partial [Choristoneura fumiferana]
AEFGLSTRGNTLIRIGEFTFYRQRAQGKKVRWWCQAAQRGCKAAIYTIDNKIIKRVGEDLVQCVPTRKGHQILYKGYTYVFKSRLQCGAEQWCCSYRQKTDKQELPEWVSIYFLKKGDNDFRCNICDKAIKTTQKSLELLDHIRESHSEVIDLHRNPDSTLGFRIEFLQLNVLNEDTGDHKSQPVMLTDICEGPTEEVVSEKVKTVSDSETSNVQYVLIPGKKNTIIFRCNICNVVLSIKGCNTNNMNRHVRTRHPSIYKVEVGSKGEAEPILDLGCEVETPYAVKTEEITASTQAQCKLCNRNISHGGNATGNMNRHIKMIHKEVYTTADLDIGKIADDNSWVWKVFESDEDDFYSCKICHFKCMKFSSIDKSVLCILKHLKADHGVISGDQIITSVDCDTSHH